MMMLLMWYDVVIIGGCCDVVGVGCVAIM